jgi:histidinol-phosphate aminotransferase
VEGRAVEWARIEWSDPDLRGIALFAHQPNARGMLHPEDRVRAFCARFPGVVLIDEAYVDFAPRTLMDLALSSDRVLVARTLSKSYSLAGLRLGYAVGPEPLIGALFKIKDSYNVDRLAQAMRAGGPRRPGCDAGEHRPDHCHPRTGGFGIDGPGLPGVPSATNFLWVRPGTMPADRVFRALRERKILVRHFTMPRRRPLEISIGTDDVNDAFLAAMRQILPDPPASAQGAGVFAGGAVSLRARSACRSASASRSPVARVLGVGQASLQFGHPLG